MISPTTKDIGRSVVYTGNRYPGGKLEEGVITSFNDSCVFVRYGADKGSKGTSRQDLEWVAALNDTKPMTRKPADEDWREVARKRWIEIADLRADIERLRAVVVDAIAWHEAERGNEPGESPRIDSWRAALKDTKP